MDVLRSVFVGLALLCVIVSGLIFTRQRAVDTQRELAVDTQRELIALRQMRDTQQQIMAAQERTIAAHERSIAALQMIRESNEHTIAIYHGMLQRAGVLPPD